MSTSRASGVRRRAAAVAFATLLGVGSLTRGAAAETFYAAHVQPMFDQACVSCHGLEKSRGGLQLHSFAVLAEGGDSGMVTSPGAAERSELYRRLTLPADHEEAMPPDGKKRLTPQQTEILRRWIQAGASADSALDAVDLAGLVPTHVRAAAPDFRPFAAELARLEKRFGFRFVPVSEKVTDGLILRTISVAGTIEDDALVALAPVAALIVDAELGRTRVTDAGMIGLVGLPNLRRLDLSHTGVTSQGVTHLAALTKLESLNLVGTRADNAAWATLRAMPALRRVHFFGTQMSAE